MSTSEQNTSAAARAVALWAVFPITALLAAPLRSWDALVCTSRAVRDTVRHLVEAQADYLRWRLGATRFELPQLPLIPLGVDCREYRPETARRAEATGGWALL